MPKIRKTYKKDYKISVVKKLKSSGKPLKEVATEEGISISSVNRWKFGFKDERFKNYLSQKREWISKISLKQLLKL